MMEDKNKKSFFEYLNYPERFKRLPTVAQEQTGINKVRELVKLVEDNKALWADEYGLTVQLTNEDAKKAILSRLTNHYDTLQSNTSRFVKEEYWLGAKGNEVVFGQVDVYLDEYDEVASGGQDDVLFRYYLPDKPLNKQEQREQVLEQLIIDAGLDELKKLGQLATWQKLTEMDSNLFSKRVNKDSTIKKFFDKQSLINFR